MREIKFRAWDGERMHYLEPLEVVRGIGGEIKIQNDDSFLDDYTGEVQPEGVIVQQYTGLKDKRGREIYEGDVVSALGHRGIVWFGGGAFKIAWDIPMEIMPEKLGLCGEMEVIGNIYENPELCAAPAAGGGE